MGKHVKPKKGGFSAASWFWVWGIVSFVTYEAFMLAQGTKGGALSHVIWWANDLDTGLYSWRWALVSGPIVGFLLWMVPHTLWGSGEGLDLLVIMCVVTAALGIVVIVH